MSLAECIIIKVMSWGDLDGTGTKVHFNVIIRDDWHYSVRNERMFRSLADQMLVSVVIRVDGNRSITQHGLYTGCSYFEELIGLCNRVLEVNDDTKFNLLLISRDR